MIFRKKPNVLPVQRKPAVFKASLASVVVLSLLVAACGGGGATSSSPSPVASASNGSVSITATATTTAQSLTVGTAMTSFTPLTPGGGATPYTYSYGGTLPAGLSFDTSTGAVTGTPTATYTTANVVFSVQDAHGVVANTTSTVSFTVGAASPTITATATTTAQSLTVGTAMTSFSPLTPSGGAAPYTYSITSGTLPAGLSLDASSGAVTGTPSATYTTANVVFSVKDANNVVAKHNQRRELYRGCRTSLYHCHGNHHGTESDRWHGDGQLLALNTQRRRNTVHLQHHIWNTACGTEP